MGRGTWTDAVMLRKRSFRHRSPRALSDRPPRKRVTDRHFSRDKTDQRSSPYLRRRRTGTGWLVRGGSLRAAPAPGTPRRDSHAREVRRPARPFPFRASPSLPRGNDPPSPSSRSSPRCRLRRWPTIPPILVVRHRPPPPARLTFRSTPLDAVAPRFAHRDSIELPELASDLILRDPTRDDG